MQCFCIFDYFHVYFLLAWTDVSTPQAHCETQRLNAQGEEVPLGGDVAGWLGRGHSRKERRRFLSGAGTGGRQAERVGDAQPQESSSAVHCSKPARCGERREEPGRSTDRGCRAFLRGLGLDSKDMVLTRIKPSYTSSCLSFRMFT